ncbi:hypothetical protein BGX38DRAFT_1140358 [Terfezia claveryi]|nr:hypothetical protein BGX38DRAFT_1140358 [Terfezia claveryi]
MSGINSSNFPPMADLPPSSPFSTAFPPSYPRPQWLFSREELEGLLLSFNIQISDLRTNKNNSVLVERVLERIVAFRTSENAFSGYKVEDEGVGLYEPDNYELLLARLHLAIEIQCILVDWASRGMIETRKTSLLGRSSVSGVDPMVRLGGEDGEADIVAAGRSRSASQSSTSKSSIKSTNIDMTTPPSTSGGERASKRLNLGNGEHGASQRPPRLSLVTSEPIMPTLPTYPYQYVDSANTASCTSAKRKWVDSAFSGYAITPSSAVYSAHATSPHSFAPGQSVLASPVTATSEKTPFLCPFYIMNPNNEHHKECAKKTYPNPRKLKEHIWRYTRPFRCDKCGEGFGRDKTRQIHGEKKVPCKPRPATEYDEGSGTYEGSREQLRDQKIETAKSTFEIINILREYEQGSGIPSNTRIIPGNQMQGINFQDPFSTQRQDTQAACHSAYLQGLGLDLGYDANVPKIVVQSYDMQALAAAHCGNYLPKALEGEGWKPMTVPTAQQPTTPPMDQGNQPGQCNLSPPTRMQRDTQSHSANGSTAINGSSPKSPTPELTHHGLSPILSPMSMQDVDEQEYVIYESPATTPSINISYWRQNEQNQVAEQMAAESGSQITQGSGMSLSGPALSLGTQRKSTSGSLGSGTQRKSTSGSLDQLAFNLLEDIESSLWDNNYQFRYI